MSSVLRYAGQIVVYGAFAVLLGGFSQAPVYRHADPALALVKLSFEHAGEPVTPCRRLTPEEIAKLAPNMRRPTDCPRRRVPLYVELALDGEVVFAKEAAPAGLAGDGSSTIYARFPVPTGAHRVTARMRDSRGGEGFDYETSQDVTLEPRQIVVVGFDSNAGQFVFLL